MIAIVFLSIACIALAVACVILSKRISALNEEFNFFLDRNQLNY